MPPSALLLAACRTQVVVFDKTGTLTVGKPEVQQVVFIKGMPETPPQQPTSHSSCCAKSATVANSKSSTSNSCCSSAAAQKCPCCGAESKGCGSGGCGAGCRCGSCCACNSASRRNSSSPNKKSCCGGGAAGTAKAGRSRSSSPSKNKQQQKQKPQPQQQKQDEAAGQTSSCCAGESSAAGAAEAEAPEVVQNGEANESSATSPFAADCIQHPEHTQQHKGALQGTSMPQQQQQQLQDSQRLVLTLLAAVEARSEHPLAKAVVSYAEKQGVRPDELHCVIEGFHSQTGRGVRCTVTPAAGSSDASSSGSDGSSAVPVDVIIGNVPWLQECGVGLSAVARQQRADMEAEGATVVAAALNGKAVALLGIADSMKPEAPAVLRLLQQRGMQCWMITGDSR